MPKKYYTRIGQKGVQLSGGQKQRIALARAIYFDRRILIMDEPTSALDSDTEEYITDELRLLKKDFAAIIVSHRDSILEICDKIFKMENGKLNLQKNNI